MRYTRFEFRGQSSIGLRRIAGYLLFIVVVGTLIGFILSRFVIAPNIQVTNNEKVEEVFIYQNIMPKKVYVVQGGVFSTRKNAETAAKIIQDKKMPVFILEDEKYYRIILYTGPNYEVINKKVIDYKASGMDYIVKETNISIKEVPENYKSKNMYISLSRIISNMGNAIDEMFEEAGKFESKQMDYIAFSSKIKDISKRLESTIELFNSIKDDNNNKFLAELKDDCQHIRNTIDSMGDNAGDLSGIEEKKFLSTQVYKNLVEHFNNNINLGV